EGRRRYVQPWVLETAEVVGGARLVAPSGVGAAAEDTESAARRVDQDAVGGGRSDRRVAAVGLDDCDVVGPAEAANVVAGQCDPVATNVGRDHEAVDSGGLAARRGTQVDGAMSGKGVDVGGGLLRRLVLDVAVGPFG